MVWYESYDPAKDVDESKSGLCNSLNAMEGYLRKAVYASEADHTTIDNKTLLALADYIYRAQSVIWYLRDQTKENTKGD